MIYFSSTYIENRAFQTLEELFKYVAPKDVALVFDTNVVVYYRDFYLAPKLFVERNKDNGISAVVRYLIEQIIRYDLKVNASLGVDESSRSKVNFSLIEEKVQQTHHALMFLLHLNNKDIDLFIKLKNAEEPIKSKGEYPDSMLDFLKEEAPYQHFLIVSYLVSLKIVLLYNKLQRREITNREAFVGLCDFMKKDIDCMIGILQVYALYLFGGDSTFKGIIFPKGSGGLNEKYHKIFNGAIDFVLPTIANMVSRYQYPNLIPVFVSIDRRISKLHSLSCAKMILQTNNSINYSELSEFYFPSNLNWTEEDKIVINQIFMDNYRERFINSYGKIRTSIHLLDLVEYYEKEIKEFI